MQGLIVLLIVKVATQILFEYLVDTLGFTHFQVRSLIEDMPHSITLLEEILHIESYSK